MLLGETGPLPAAGTVGGGTSGSRGCLSRIIYKQGEERGIIIMHLLLHVFQWTQTEQRIRHTKSIHSFHY